MLPGGGSALLQTGAQFFTHHGWSKRGEGAGRRQDQTQLRTHHLGSAGEQRGNRSHLRASLQMAGSNGMGTTAIPCYRDLQEPRAAASCRTGDAAPAAGASSGACRVLASPSLWLLCKMAAARLEDLGRKGLFSRLRESRGRHGRVQQEGCFKKAVLKTPL